MTLKTKIRSLFGIAILFLVVIQYLIITNLLVRFSNDYITIPTFIIGTTLIFIVVVFFFLDKKLLSRFYYLHRVIATITKGHSGLVDRSLIGKDEISRLTDYIFGIREELQKSKDDLQNSHALDVPPKNCTSYNVRKTKSVKRGELDGKERLHTGTDYK